MGLLANIAGSGAGIIVIAVVIIGLRYLTHLPNGTHNWIRRIMIVLMYGAGGLLAFTGIGVVWVGIVNWASGFFGGPGAPIPHAVLVIASVLLILGLIVGIWKAPTPEVVMAAALVPAVLMLTSYGAIHHFWVLTEAPAQQLALQFNAWLGG